MQRREFLTNAAAMGVVLTAFKAPELAAQQAKSKDQASAKNKLTPPSKARIPVAVTVSEGVTVIDFAGPWEVFQDVMISGRGEGMEQMPFELFTVSEKTEPLRGSAGLQIVPDHTFANAPSPKIVVVPAQRGSATLHEWLRKVTPAADVVMSVCTGAFQLAKAGLLSGKSATTHHDYFDQFAKQHPDVELKRGLRFVEGEKISTAGGLTSGIDLALRVVERYFGREVAQTTAVYMEYQSKGWMI